MYQIKNRLTGAVIHEYGETAKECLENGVAAGINFDFAELNDAKLNYAKLNYAELNYAELNYAQLIFAQLNDAQLNYAKLNYAQLNGAELKGAELNYAQLNGAQLNGAKLKGAELKGAELNYAQLNGAKLKGAELNNANLHSIKYEFFGKLALQYSEITGLRQAIVDGRIDGSSYEGNCACFIGTIANVKGVMFTNTLVERDVNSLTERWFLAIRKGDTPENNPAAKITLNWIDEFVAKCQPLVCLPAARPESVLS